jgi:hypothetical protein
MMVPLPLFLHMMSTECTEDDLNDIVSLFNSDEKYDQKKWRSRLDLSFNNLNTLMRMALIERNVFFTDPIATADRFEDFYVWAGYVPPGKITVRVFDRKFWYTRAIKIPWRKSIERIYTPNRNIPKATAKTS